MSSHNDKLIEKGPKGKGSTGISTVEAPKFEKGKRSTEISPVEAPKFVAHTGVKAPKFDAHTNIFVNKNKKESAPKLDAHA